MDAIESALRKSMSEGKDMRLVLADRLEELGREIEAAELRALIPTAVPRWRPSHRYYDYGGSGGYGGYGGSGGYGGYGGSGGSGGDGGDGGYGGDGG